MGRQGRRGHAWAVGRSGYRSGTSTMAVHLAGILTKTEMSPSPWLGQDHWQGTASARSLLVTGDRKWPGTTLEKARRSFTNSHSKKSRGCKGLWDGWALGLRECNTNVSLSVCPLPPVFLDLFLCLQLKVGFPHTMGELGMDKDGASCPVPASDPRRKSMAPLNRCV